MCCCVYKFIYFYLFLATPCSMWDLSYPSKDWTCAPCVRSVESLPLNHKGNPINSSNLSTWYQPYEICAMTYQLMGRKVRQGHAEGPNTAFCLPCLPLTQPSVLLTFPGVLSRSAAVSGSQLPCLWNKREKLRKKFRRPSCSVLREGVAMDPR